MGHVPGVSSFSAVILRSFCMPSKDERGVEIIRGGKFEIKVGVEGSAEGRVATASLEVAGDDAMIFSLPQP